MEFVDNMKNVIWHQPYTQMKNSIIEGFVLHIQFSPVSSLHNREAFHCIEYQIHHFTYNFP